MTNNRNYYVTHNYTDYSSFGGNVYNYDFDGYISMSDMASRILSDMKFDKKCRKNLNDKKKGKDNTYGKSRKHD